MSDGEKQTSFAGSKKTLKGLLVILGLDPEKKTK